MAIYNREHFENGLAKGTWAFVTKSSIDFTIRDWYGSQRYQGSRLV
jgi:hypothetical protein